MLRMQILIHYIVGSFLNEFWCDYIEHQKHHSCWDLCLWQLAPVHFYVNKSHRVPLKCEEITWLKLTERCPSTGLLESSMRLKPHWGSDLQKKGIMGIVCLHCGDGDLSHRCVQWVSRPSSLEHHSPLDTDLYDVISCFEDLLLSPCSCVLLGLSDAVVKNEFRIIYFTEWGVESYSLYVCNMYTHT